MNYCASIIIYDTILIIANICSINISHQFLMYSPKPPDSETSSFEVLETT